LLYDRGIKTAIVTTENTSIVQKRADKLHIDYLCMGTWKKLEYIEKVCAELNITLDEVAYIGDDINDFELLSAVKYRACPKNAVKRIKEIPNIIKIEKNGGDGAVREFIEILLKSYE